MATDHLRTSAPISLLVLLGAIQLIAVAGILLAGYGVVAIILGFVFGIEFPNPFS